MASSLGALLSSYRPLHTPIDLLTQPRAGSSGHAHHYAPLLHKLHRGEAISMVAVGSSVVAYYGGCTRPSSVHPVCSDESIDLTHWSTGWARTFFDQFNATYPHPENALYNLGIGGGSNVPVLLACPSNTFVDIQPDIVLFDPLTTEDAEGTQYERFVRSMLLRHPPPLAVLVEFPFPVILRPTVPAVQVDKAAPGTLRIHPLTRAASACDCKEAAMKDGGGYKNGIAKSSDCTLGSKSSLLREAMQVATSLPAVASSLPTNDTAARNHALARAALDALEFAPLSPMERAQAARNGGRGAGPSGSASCNTASMVTTSASLGRKPRSCHRGSEVK